MHRSDDGGDADRGAPAVVLADLTYTGGLATIAEARDALAEAVLGHVDAEDLEAVRLLTSELVANCHRHGVGPVRVCVTREGDRIAVTVSDEGAGRVRTREPELAGPGGYGMHLVEAFSLGWEQVEAEIGTTVRFWIAAAG